MRSSTAIRVMLVDDSPAARRALRDLLSGDRDIQIVGEAGDPFEAVELMRKDLPDVLILDLQLPKMDGLTFLRKVMSQKPIPVVVCSGYSAAGSQAAMEALSLGACEVVPKPRIDTPQARAEAVILLTHAVRAAAEVGAVRRGRLSGAMQSQSQPQAQTAPGRPANAPRDTGSGGPAPKLTADAVLPPYRPGGAQVPGQQPLIAIGASTGGTEALARILPELRADTPAVVIVQHMPEKFTTAFARRLDGLCAMTVREAQDGDRPEQGLILIAPGNMHMVVHRQGRGYRVEILEGPHVARHRPSVDVMYRSVAVAAGARAMGVLLTGMGDDGARGLDELRQSGADTVVQDEASSVVWGMPGEAYRMGAARRVVALDRMAREIMTHQARSEAG